MHAKTMHMLNISSGCGRFSYTNQLWPSVHSIMSNSET